MYPDEMHKYEDYEICDSTLQCILFVLNLNTLVTTFAAPSIFHGSDFDFENVSSGSTPHHGAPTSLAP